VTKGTPASGAEQHGVIFPVTADGHRSTSALGRAVVADALARTDPAGARAVSREANWRSGYLAHFRRLIVAGLPSRQAAVAVARDGLASLHGRMRMACPGEPEAGLGALVSAPARHELTAVPVPGGGTAERELAVPYRGERLTGSALLRQLDAWVAAGVIESSCADAVRAVAASPEWLAVPGRTVVVLGAGAEVGPLPVLLSWGARIIGIDLSGPAIWDRVLETAQRSGGTLLVPVADAKPGPDGPYSGEDLGPLARRAGFDLTTDVPAVADWLAGVDGPLVLGNYVYADGAANVRVASAVDALTVRLLAERRDIALGFLATPTDVFAVPADAVAQSARAYAARPAMAKLGRGLLQSLSGGRLLRPAYPPGADPGICDSLVAQQGPNYALAKRLQRWRATVARDGGATVSMNVAPPTRTRSVTKNRVLAAAYAGAGRFGVEVFEPATTKTLMAALLVHDLHAAGDPATGHPWQDEAHAAAHGGLWRTAYAPRSALSLAALLGFAAAGNRARGSLPDQRQPVVRVRRAPRGGQHPGEVVGQVGRTAAQSTPRQQVVQDRRGQREPLRRGDRLPAQPQGQVQAVHHRLDHAAGHELVHLHGSEIARPHRAGRDRAALLDRLAERFGQDARHVSGRLAVDHGVGVLVDDRSRFRARVDEEAGPVAGRRQLGPALDQHPGQADGDVEVPGQLEHRPVRQVGINRDEKRGHRPLRLGQAAEHRLDPG
jgi:hypothetical protein